jgi:hypothetical protein
MDGRQSTTEEEPTLVVLLVGYLLDELPLVRIIFAILSVPE